MTIETSTQPEAFARFEHEGWEQVSAAYDQSFGRLTPQSAEALLDAAGVDGDTSLLDVCCGPGMVAEAAVARGANVTGLDFSAAAIALAGSRVEEARFVEGDAQALPFDANHFDAAVCGFGLIHLPDAARGLAEMIRVVRPGGRIAVKRTSDRAESTSDADAACARVIDRCLDVRGREMELVGSVGPARPNNPRVPCWDAAG